MKRNKTKILALSLLASLCVGAGAGLMAYNAQTGSATISAKADSYGSVLFETVSTLKMEGAAVRVSGDTSGMRFTSSISQAEYEALASKYTVTMGMLIIPANKLTGELSLKNTTDSIKNVSTTNVEELSVKGDNYEFRAVLKDIPETSFGRDIVGRGYITISDGTETVTYYTDDATRNIAYVAYMASEVDETSAYYQANNEVLVNYIGGKAFYELDLPAGVECDYAYAYAGQEVAVSVMASNSTNTLTINGAASYEQNGNSYNIVMGDSAVSISGFAVMVDMTAGKPYDFDLSKNATAKFINVVGNITSITDGFTYADGVLTTTATAGDYVVEIVTDAGYTYKFNAAVVTKVIDSASEFAAFVSASQTGYFVLGCNIDASNISADNASAAFTGTFDGRGYAINGITIVTASTTANGGIFGDITAGSVVKNTAFTGVKLNVHPYATTSVLTGAQRLHGTIKDCYIEVVSLTSSSAGYGTGNIKAAGICAHADGGVINNVIMKTSATLYRGVCDMVLGSSNISATYIIGGVTQNSGWNQNGSPVSVATVSSLNATQQATFSSDIWGFANGTPYFVNGSIKATGVSLDVCLDKADKEFGSKYIHLTNDLGIANGNVEAIIDGEGDAVPFVTSGEYIVINPTKLGKQAMCITVDGVQYTFEATVITQVIETAEEFAAFVSSSQSGYFVLGDNIDASNISADNASAAFTGTFDGRGYAINDITIVTADTTANGGIFGDITAGSVVKNTAFTGVKLNVHPYATTSVLTGAQRLHGTIKDCYIEVVSLTSSSAGYGTGNIKAAGICAHADGGVINNVIMKTSATLYRGVCDMVLGSSNISATYVIGGVTQNSGWNQNSSPVSVATVSSLSEAQQASFDPTIWGFENGVPYFKKTRVDFSTATKLEVAAQKIYANAEEGTQEISMAKLGISGTVEKVYDSTGKALNFAATDNGFTVSNAQGGSQVMYAIVSGTLYGFDVNVVNSVITTADELVAFASAVQNGYFELGGNIVVNGTKISATKVSTDGGFSGVFDGCGYVIDGAYITNGGLFGGISSYGTVKNLGFINTKYGYSGAGSAFGDANYGTIDNCYIQVVEQGYDSNGALTTYCALSALSNVNYGTISNCVTVLPDFGTGEHKAVCQLNYGTLQNVYCMGTETTLTYTAGEGTATNVVKVSTLTAAQQATLNADIWGFENGVPYFKFT